MASADPLASACDWDPARTLAQRNPLQAFDDLRNGCPLARSAALGWSVTRHRDVLRVLHDHETFSNAVSRHLSVPNGMDPPRHAGFRSLVERYFTPDFIEPFGPVCRRLVREGLDCLPRNQAVELMDAFARPFAARAQCAFLGWPDGLHGRLIEWTLENQRATREQDRDRLHELAADLHAQIGELLAERRRGVGRGDITAHLLDETVDGRSLSAEEIVSILRNWTVGEVGTLSAAIGILVQHLARGPELQMQLRTRPERIPGVIDEVLRIDGPLVANRRVTTKPVELGGRELPAGARVSILWIAANRDPAAFADAAACRPGRGSTSNLLYGAGIHVCPGAPLARLELRVMIEELFAATRWIEADPVRRPTGAVWPGAGPAQLPVRLRG